MIRKCPICGKEMKSYDIDYNFDGNQDEYYDCENCHHSFEYHIRYHKVWKYEVWDLYFDKSLNEWCCIEDSLKTVVVYKKEK